MNAESNALPIPAGPGSVAGAPGLPSGFTDGTAYDDRAVGGHTTAHDRELLGPVMGYVAVTVGFAALGAYLGRDLSGAIGLLLFIAAFATVFALNGAAARRRDQLAIGLLFGLGLLLGLATAPVIADYADADPSAVWQAAGATAAFVAALGAYGYATRRDLSSWARTLFGALLALIVFGIVTVFVSIPNGNVIYAVAGLVIFGGFTIFDFNRLRRSAPRCRRPDRGRDLPRRLQHLPDRRGALRRPAGVRRTRWITPKVPPTAAMPSTTPDDAGSTSGRSLAGAPTSWASIPRGGWWWSGSS